MRIAFLSTFYPFRGGIAQFNAALYRAMEKKNEVRAFTFSKQYPDLFFPGSSQYVTATDIVDKIEALPLLNTINPISYFTTAKAIRKYEPDLVLMKYWLPFFAPSLGSVSRLLKKKTKIISILDNVTPHEHRIGDRLLNKYFLSGNHGFVAMSNVVKEDLLSIAPAAKYLLHPHPLYDHFGKKADQKIALAKLGLPAGKKIILFFGFIRDYKGLDLLIEAMKNMPDDALLLVAGEVYGDFKKYEEQISRSGLEERIKLFIRYINDDEVPLFFSAADVCVLPYRSATQSGITSISYHFDLPIIATDVGGLKESIKHNETGLVVRQADAQLIRESLIEYFQNDLKQKFQSNIEYLKKESSWDHLAESILDFAKKI